MTTDVWQKGVDAKLEKMDLEIQELKISDRLQEREINTLKTTLGKIEENTTWIKRAIIGAIITAVIVAVVGGLVTIAVNTIYGGTEDESKLESSSTQ